MAGWASAVAIVLVVSATIAEGSEPTGDSAPSPTPPPLPPRPAPASPPISDAYEDAAKLDDAPWGIPNDLLSKLEARAVAYVDYAVRFSATETVRAASYGGSGEADKEKVRQYSYLLERGRGGEDFREIRQRMRSDGTPRSEEVQDAESFPPAYSWAFIFSKAFQPYFTYRDRGERYDGFDWVHEIEFRGALPFTDGKDVREWEGSVLVDAATFTPLEIRAEPTQQRERIRFLFQRWKQAFSLVGWHMAPKPLGYRCRVVFRLHQDGLTFPTELRYDTFIATSLKSEEPRAASIRGYDDYRFFKTESVATQAPKSP